MIAENQMSPLLLTLPHCLVSPEGHCVARATGGLLSGVHKGQQTYFSPRLFEDLNSLASFRLSGTLNEF